MNRPVVRLKEVWGGCHPDYEEEKTSHLHLAVQSGSVECVQILLAAGAVVNAQRRGQTPLELALLCKNRTSLMKTLMAAGAKLSSGQNLEETPDDEEEEGEEEEDSESEYRIYYDSELDDDEHSDVD